MDVVSEGKGKAGPTGQLGGSWCQLGVVPVPQLVPAHSISSLDFPLAKGHSTGFQFQRVQQDGRLRAETRTIKGFSGQQNS